jgi:hypothetical protein
MKNLRYIFFVFVVFASCDEPFRLDLEQTPPKIVIEGLVTDQTKMQMVKVSRSAHFYGTGNTPRVTDAVVTISDDLGNVFDMVHNPNSHADSIGVYVPAVSFSGVIGRTYTLRVLVDGAEYEAVDKLSSVIPIDSLAYRVNEEQAEDPEEEGKIYEVLMFAREPQDEENFYLFKFFRNDSLTLANDTDIYFSDDALLAEQIDGVPTPIYYARGDTARVEVYSISRTGFVFFSDLFTVLSNDAGGMFGPIPASPRTNLSNGALGFFQVSAVNMSETKIE